MNINTDHGMCYEFDGRLTFSTGESAVIECHVCPALVAGRKAHIDLRVPSTSMPLSGVENPCHVESLDAEAHIQIQLEHVWFRSITDNQIPKRVTGSVPITLTHVGQLTICRSKKFMPEFGTESAKPTVRFYLNDNVFLGSTSLMMAIHGKLSEREDHLYQVEVPDLGVIRFVREWVMLPTSEKNDVIVQS
ncbi:hypothetical protein AAKU61_004293 [Undibacterium sp. GrIS 1.2]|uniref:hypothetical protein n=1 Tax=Undibacterium sp. GrIS 1.2 TaxID=3143933 RepID=UPI003390DE89